MYTSAEIILLANNARVDNGFPVLSINSKLGLAAAAAAKDMFSKQYFAHFSPGGVSPWTWIRNTGYKYSAVGENLAIDFIDAGDIVASWLDSPTHRKILLGSYNDTGVAVLGGTMNDLPAVIVVQFFGSPATANITVPVVVTQKRNQQQHRLPLKLSRLSFRQLCRLWRCRKRRSRSRCLSLCHLTSPPMLLSRKPFRPPVNCRL